jgi:hypothetical protein
MLDEIDFEPVVSAHVRESPVAGKEAHGSGAISLESAPNREEPTGGVKYIAVDVPGMKSVLDAYASDREPIGVVEEDDHRGRLATVLEASEKQAARVDSAETVDKEWD